MGDFVAPGQVKDPLAGEARTVPLFIGYSRMRGRSVQNADGLSKRGHLLQNSSSPLNVND